MVAKTIMVLGFSLLHWQKNTSVNNKHITKNTSSISDDIMQGNIIDALNKAEINPFNNNGKISNDFIPLLLKNDELKFAFSKYCEQKKKQPLWVVRYAIIKLLKEEKLYEP